MQKKKISFRKKTGGGQPIWKKILFRSLLVLLTAVLIISFASIGIGAGLVSALTKDEKIRTKTDFDKELENLSQTSTAFFRETNGKTEKVGEMINPDDRQLVTDLKQVSPYLLNAFLSIEDREFYDHHGVVPRSILRATLQQLTGSDVTTGGSTLTQQLVKTHFLDYKDKSYKRKAIEIINALRVERYYDKDDIFKKYLNSVFFGAGAHGKKMYGVNAAARGLFNKKSNDLNLAQAAYIAGMVQRPNAYNPFRGDEELKYGTDRMKLVLKKMLELGKISQAQYNEAIKFDIKSSLAKPNMFTNGFNKYPFIITAVENEAVKILKELDQKNPEAKERADSYYSNLVRQGGFRFFTTIDKNMYAKINEVGNSIHYPTREFRGMKIREQIGATIIENKTGGILAFYAGKFEENQQDHALEAENQPGSSIKPLVVYGPGLNEGVISPNSTIIDEPIKKAGSSDVYRNSDGKYRGGVTATEALKKSLNIPAIKIFRRIESLRGSGKPFSYLRQMDLPPHKKDGEALALGGATLGYTVRDMTAAFAMIANNGEWNKGHIISRIETSDGKVLYDFARDKKPKNILQPQAAYQLTKMLRQVVTGGTASVIGGSTGGYNIAGKTGTTSSEYDLWFVGFTPEVSMGVWSGYDYNKVGDHMLAKTAWIKLFQAAATASPSLIPKGSEFKDPGGSLNTQCFECGKKSTYSDEDSDKKSNKKYNKKSDRFKKKRPQTPDSTSAGSNGNGGNNGGGRNQGNGQGGNGDEEGDNGNDNGTTPPPGSDDGLMNNNNNGGALQGGNQNGNGQDNGNAISP
ncbi:penicillin-binding protein [Seinonella peptonophila]|uniref:Penicillin-binding protein n=1 Tax=Seinonella peptonophila TaxID=112248 RepID=A0A1M4VNF3_9BACL|nr:transglycosylase domain-containing protein [Seinonella peptonophila]SHE70377.1 penicillin-binding protein [Seinonella peptonophila]